MRERQNERERRESRKFALAPTHSQRNKNNNQNDELYEERERLPTYDFINEHERNGRLRKFNTRVTTHRVRRKKKMK